MLDVLTASFGILGIVLSVGMLIFSLRLWRFFLGSKIGSACRGFGVSSVVLTVISVVTVLQAGGVVVLPTWWREGSAFLFRLVLFYALYEVYRAWTNFGKN